MRVTMNKAIERAAFRIFSFRAWFVQVVLRRCVEASGGANRGAAESDPDPPDSSTHADRSRGRRVPHRHRSS